MLRKISGASKRVLDKVKMPAKAAESYVVALDIGTENIKALIARIKGDVITIIGVGKAHQSLHDMQAGAIADIDAVTTNCDAALAEAEEQAGMSGYQVVIGIAGELVKGNTITVRLNRKDAEKPLDQEEMQRIMEAARSKALETAKKQLAEETGGKEIDVRLVNSAIVRMQIDGYDITNPIGFQGREVNLQLFTAFAPLVHIGALESVAEALDLELLAVAAEPFAVARAVLGNDESQKMNAIIMDVGGGTTDIAVINEGGVEGTKMFGIGGRAYTRSIEKNMGVSYKQAEAIKVGLSQNRVPHQKVPSVETAINKTLSVWLSGVELSLGEFNVDNLPRDILLCGGGASLQMLTESLENTDWHASLPFASKPKTRLITPDLLHRITNSTDIFTDHTFITAMGLLRIGADTISTTNAGVTNGKIKDTIHKVLKV